MRMSFMIPKLPNVAQPDSPLVSVAAAQARDAAATQAEKDAVAGGRESTIHAGTDIAYGAGMPLLNSKPKGAAKTSMGY
jgi:hypothetical protein